VRPADAPEITLRLLPTREPAAAINPVVALRPLRPQPYTAPQRPQVQKPAHPPIGKPVVGKPGSSKPKVDIFDDSAPTSRPKVDAIDD